MRWDKQVQAAYNQANTTSSIQVESNMKKQKHNQGVLEHISSRDLGGIWPICKKVIGWYLAIFKMAAI